MMTKCSKHFNYKYKQLYGDITVIFGGYISLSGKVFSILEDKNSGPMLYARIKYLYKKPCSVISK